MQQTRSSTEAVKRLSAIERAVAIVRNASHCVCEGCGGEITGAGFIEEEPELVMWHEECLDNAPITDIHRTAEGHYAFSDVPPGTEEVLMAVRVGDFGMARSQRVQPPRKDATAQTSPDPLGEPSQPWRIALAEAIAKAQGIGEQLLRVSIEPFDPQDHFFLPMKERRRMLFESQEAVNGLARTITEALRLFDDALAAPERTQCDAAGPDEDAGVKGPSQDWSGWQGRPAGAAKAGL